MKHDWQALNRGVHSPEDMTLNDLFEEVRCVVTEDDVQALAFLLDDGKYAAFGQRIAALFKFKVSNKTAPGKRDVFWLIERGQSEGQAPTLWWLGYNMADFPNLWTKDAARAKRFRTRKAAQWELDQLSGIHGIHSPFGRVTEHALVGGVS